MVMDTGSLGDWLEEMRWLSLLVFIFPELSKQGARLSGRTGNGSGELRSVNISNHVLGE